MTSHSDPVWLRCLPKALRHHVAGRFHLHAVIHNSGWLLFDKLARVFMGLLVGAWVARYLGPRQYGELAYVLAYLAFFQSVVTLGLEGIVVRDIALHKERAAQILGTAFALRLGCGTVAWLLAIAGMALQNGWSDRSVGLTLLAASTLVFQSADTADLWFQSQSQSRLTIAAKFSAYLVANALKVALILGQAPLIAFAGVVGFEAGLAALGLLLVYRRNTCGQPWEAVAAQGRQLLKESWPLVLSGVSIAVYMRIDLIMIKRMLGEAALGVYAAALPFSSYWQIISVTLSVSLAPYISRRRLGDSAQYRKSIVLVFRGFFYLGLLTAIFTWAVSGWIIPLLYGPGYLGAIQVLNVHAISNVFCFLGVAHGLWLINERRFAVRLIGTVLAGVSAVLVNLALLPRLGLVGACYSAIIAQAVGSFLVNALFDRESFKLQMEAITFKRFS